MVQRKKGDTKGLSSSIWSLFMRRLGYLFSFKVVKKGEGKVLELVLSFIPWTKCILFMSLSFFSYLLLH